MYTCVPLKTFKKGILTGVVGVGVAAASSTGVFSVESKSETKSCDGIFTFLALYKANIVNDCNYSKRLFLPEIITFSTSIRLCRCSPFSGLYK